MSERRFFHDALDAIRGRERDYTSGPLAQAALLLASEAPEKVNGRVTYSQQILGEFGWIDNPKGRGVDSRGSGYSEI